MTKEEFILFIEDLGFTQTWMSKSNGYSLATDSADPAYKVIGNPNQNLMAFADQLKITLDDERGIAQLSLSQMSTHMMAGKNFGNFQLSTFGNDGDFQLEIFMSFVKGAFKKPPNDIIQYMRDKKIRDILK
jgi:hypothetical protein